MNHYLLKTIEFGPVVLERIVDKVPADKLDHRLGPDRFTIREAIAHLADWEAIFRARIQQVIDEPGSAIVPKDEEQMAIDNRYSEQDVNDNLARFKRERCETASLLRSLTPSQWDAAGVHPEAGRMSVYDIAEMIQGHDMYHIEHASCYLP